MVNRMIHTELVNAFVTGLPFESCVIDSQTGKHLLVNESYIADQGFKQREEILRMTLNELFALRRNRIEKLQGDLQLEAEYKVRIHYAHQYVCEESKWIRFPVHYLSLNGFVRAQELIKIPLLENGQVQALLTYAVERTDRLDLVELYQLYQRHYPKHMDAIRSFLGYLKLAQHFYTLPTHRELLALLTMCKHEAAKFVAAQLGIHSRTVEEYKHRLRSKLNGVNLQHLLILLRKYHYTLIGNA
jgi:DNA-binding CsgD family transcriptional regulator